MILLFRKSIPKRSRTSGTRMEGSHCGQILFSAGCLHISYPPNTRGTWSNMLIHFSGCLKCLCLFCSYRCLVSISSCWFLELIPGLQLQVLLVMVSHHFSFRSLLQGIIPR